MTKQILDGNIKRQMTDEELANYETICAERQAEAQAEQDQKALKAEVIAKLGLSADEVAALLS